MKVGVSSPQQEAWEKVTGRAIYGEDIRLPGLLVGKVLRSPFTHARLKSIDVTAAKRIPGVMAVVTAEDTTNAKFGTNVDEYALAVDKVRYVGEEVAAVAAIDADKAAAALEAIKVEYEELPSVHTFEDAIAPGAPLVHEVYPGNIAFHIDVCRGDVPRALADADLILEDDFTTPEDHHGYIETLNSTASYDNGHFVIWSGLQNVLRARIPIASCLGVQPSQIRVIRPMIGGSFGGKSGTNIKPVIISALLAMKAGMPVRVANTRAEDMYAGRPQTSMQLTVKTAWKRDGTLLARTSKLLQEGGAYSGSGPAVLQSAAVRGDDLYKIHAIHTVADQIYTNNTPVGHLRGFGVPQGVFPLEILFDRAAKRLGIDPIELRLRNAVEAGDAPTLHGRIYKSCGLKECMTVAREKSRWSNLRPLQPDNKRFREGVGMANVIHVAGNKQAFPGFDGATVLTRLEEDGRVNVFTGHIDAGQASNTVFGQITAEVLNLPVSEIVVYSADSLYHAFDPGFFANRGTVVVGNATKLAAEDLKRKMIKSFAADASVPEEAIDIVNWEFIFVNDSDRKPVPVRDIARKLLYGRIGQYIQGIGSYTPPNTTANRTTLFGNISSAYCFGSEVVKVEVDTWTGIVKILDICAVFDIGTPVNPKSAEGQAEGGIVNGVGWALSESVAVDAKGRMLNPNFTDYKLPTALDTPPMKVYFVGKPDPLGPFGAKSIGQAPGCPVPPAVVNAIYHATGVFYPEYPINPEKLLRKLKEAR